MLWWWRQTHHLICQYLNLPKTRNHLNFNTITSVPISIKYCSSPKESRMTGGPVTECVQNGSGMSSLNRKLLQNMAELPQSEFVNFLKNIDAIMFDCDGVLWIGDTVMPGADVLVERLRTVGKRLFFVTNNSTRTREEFVAKFNKLGFQANLDEVISSSYLAALYLKERNFQKKVYVVGTRGITSELSAIGIQSLPIGSDPIEDDGGHWLASNEVKTMKLDADVGAVVVGFDQFFNYKKMFKAASYLQDKDVHFIATNTDEQFPHGNMKFVIPGTGAIVNGVKTAAGREPVVIGKPSPVMFDFIQRTYKFDPSRILMVGDRGNTDIMFGRRANVWTLLVLTGVTKLDEAQRWQSSGSEEEKECIPHFYLNEVNDLLKLLTANGF